MALAATLEGKFFPLRTGISIHVDSDGMEMDSIVPILF
jgi:7,8-dihydropterin-6-yl-methyl-4-(beta-D-ribofuranosyl)aminobenzene 5'-phosphate synthase